MHTQDTKFEWPLIQCISVKPLLRLNIYDKSVQSHDRNSTYLRHRITRGVSYSSS